MRPGRKGHVRHGSIAGSADRRKGGLDWSAPYPPGVLMAVAICVGVLWRVALAAWIVPGWEMSGNVAPFPDDYPALAESLIHNGSLGYGPGRGADPTTVRGPGFPLWLAMGIGIGGSGAHWLGFWSSVPILILAPILAGRAWRSFGAPAAAASYVFLVFHPLPGVLSARVMSDEFYAACGFGALLLWDSANRARRRNVLFAIAAGALIGLQILTRSSGLLFLLVLFGIGVARPPRRPVLLYALAVVALLPPLAWSIRSSRLEGRPVFVHSMVAYNFWIGEGFDRYGYGWTSNESWQKVVELVASNGRMAPQRKRDFYYPDLTPRETAELESHLQRAAVQHVRDHPGEYALRFLKGLYRFWVQAQTKARTIQYALFLLPVLVLALPAFRAKVFGRLCLDGMFASSVLVIVAHNLTYAATLPMARFSVQVYPELAWLLAAGIGCVWSGQSLGGNLANELAH